MKPYSDYAEVPQTEGGASEHEKWTDDAPHVPAPEQRTSGATKVLLYCTYVAALACSLLNITLRLFPSAPPPMMPDPVGLEYPSVYIDLDKVHFGRPFLEKVQPVNNFANVYGLISVNRASEAITETIRWMTAHGSVSPDEHRVMITQDVSTILQFRVLDYGMEKCEVAVSVPTEAAIRTKFRNNNLELRGNTSAIDVWELDAAAELDVLKLTKRSAPPRKRKVGTVEFALGKVSSTGVFPCKSQALLTYELACPGRYCFIDYVQDNEAPLLGVYVRQSVSLAAA